MRTTTEPQRGSASVGYAASTLYVASIVVVVAIARARNGEFAYPLDDPYIHLRLAQNLLDGTLGLNVDEFASASSSPAWPVLIAAVASVTGPRVGVPLLLAVVAGVGLLLGVDRWARRLGMGTALRSGQMAVILLLMPLPAVTLTGMEHVLQAGLVFLVASMVVERTCGPPSSGGPGRQDLMLALATAAAAAVRFELVFVLVPASLLLLWRRRWWSVLAAWLGAAVPVCATALVNLGQGWPALPTPLIAKSITGRDAAGLQRLLPGLPAPSPDHVRVWLPALLLVGLWFFSHRSMAERWPVRATAWSSIALGATVLHYGFVQVGALYRYEAYLVVLLSGALAVSLHAVTTDAVALDVLRRTPTAARLAAFALVAVTLVGSLGSFALVMRGMTEVHLQQLQMARFMRESCPGCTVVVNDIGAVAMYGGGRIIDDYGLASEQVLDAKLDGTWDTDAVDALARREGADLAMVYDTAYWLPGVPDEWDPIGTWSLDHHVAVADEEVSLFSLDPTRTDELRRAFERFDLAPEVEVRVHPQP
ncbi:MAG: hypothetical protein ACK4V6_16650 [Microthrixaceae bacterium]